MNHHVAVRSRGKRIGKCTEYGLAQNPSGTIPCPAFARQVRLPRTYRILPNTIKYSETCSCWSSTNYRLIYTICKQSNESTESREKK